MKKKIAILGSTGSIGKSLINILKKDINNFYITLLTADKNINELIKQVKIFKVKNIIVTNHKKFLKIKNLLKNKKINIYNNFDAIDKIFNKMKNDYVMSAISGLSGLEPTIKIQLFVVGL
jgi:1-deoxy-D-xylulose-5-phosphate reductoisomerase